MTTTTRSTDARIAEEVMGVLKDSACIYCGCKDSGELLGTCGSCGSDLVKPYTTSVSDALEAAERLARDRNGWCAVEFNGRDDLDRRYTATIELDEHYGRFSKVGDTAAEAICYTIIAVLDGDK